MLVKEHLEAEFVLICCGVHLLQSLYDQVVDGIASARRVTPAAVQDAINAAPLLPQAAVAAGLLDGLLYRWVTHVQSCNRQLVA